MKKRIFKRNLLRFVFFALIFLVLLSTFPFLYPLENEQFNPDELVSENGRFYQVGDTEMYVEEYNPDKGDVIFLVHGFGGSTYSWRYVIDDLRNRDYRIIAVDLAGFGLSDKSYGIDFSHPAQAERINILLEKLEIDSAAFMGHSAGGNVVMHFYDRYPEKVEKIILVAGALQLEKQSVPTVVFQIPPVRKWATLILQELMTKDRFSGILSSAYNPQIPVLGENGRAVLQKIHQWLLGRGVAWGIA